MENQPVKTFTTPNVDLATYLIMEGIKFLGCVPSSSNSRVVLLKFEDSRQNCLDLERVFLSSDFKRYRDLNKWLLGQIHDALRSNDVTYGDR